MDLTEDLREYAKSLKLDFIGFCSVDSFYEAPEDRRPNVYLENRIDHLEKVIRKLCRIVYHYGSELSSGVRMELAEYRELIKTS